jgi:hypothetical protein
MKPRPNRRFATLMLAAAAPLLLAADCQDPQVNLPSDVRSVAIPTFSNRSNRAGLEFDVTQRVLHEFMSTSRLGVTPKVEEADAVIRGEIYDYQRTPISWDQTNRIVQYKIRIFCRVSFEDRRTGKEIWRADDIDGIASYSLLATPPETEESAIFKAADELARDINFLIFEQRQYTEDDLLFSQEGQMRPGEVQRR